jgi:preprotein translocase subunit SecE
MARNRQRARDRKQGLQQPTHENVPGELEHASGEVDEFDARLISGAGGEPPFDDDAAETAFDEEPEERAPRAVAGPRPGGNRLLNFLRACWAELQRVQWPDRRQVAQATAVVIGFVAIAGAYLGLADAAAKQIVDAII